MRNISEIVLLRVEIDERTSLIQHISKLTQFKIYISKSLIRPRVYVRGRIGIRLVESAIAKLILGSVKLHLTEISHL